MQLFGQLDRFNQFFTGRKIDARLMVFANIFAVSRNLDDFHLIDVNKFIGSNARGPCHSSNVVKQPKQALIGNGSNGLPIIRNLDALFLFNGLLNPSIDLHSAHQAAIGFVQQDHLAILNQIVVPTLLNKMRLQSQADMPIQFTMLLIEQIVNSEPLLCL